LGNRLPCHLGQRGQDHVILGKRSGPCHLGQPCHLGEKVRTVSSWSAVSSWGEGQDRVILGIISGRFGRKGGHEHRGPPVIKAQSPTRAKAWYCMYHMAQGQYGKSWSRGIADHWQSFVWYG
jgi:hypothetical protein